jgi:hypothetical protein
MTTFRNRSSAGDSVEAGGGGRVSAAAVWEPSGFEEGTAAERHVRTLRPTSRTQGRAYEGGSVLRESEPPEQGSGPRETSLTYLLGALLGLAVVSAFLVGTDEAEGPAPAGPTATHRFVVPQNG